jgi:hypothetical protein
VVSIDPDQKHSAWTAVWSSGVLGGLEEKTMHPEDKSMASNVGKTVLILVGFMIAIIIVANVIA